MAKVKADQLKQIEFIKTALRSGSKRGKIWQKFGKIWQNMSERTFDRRLKEAEKDLQEEQKRIQKEAEKGIQKEIEQRKSKILTTIERKEILTQIALGKIPLKKPMVCDGVIELIDVVPDWMDRKNAIAELNKMDGDYAPQKLDHTTKGNEIRQFNIVTPKPDDSK